MNYNKDQIVGVIHAKGSSERIIRKNFCLVQGVPLFLCQAINLANLIGKENVYIDSESEEILYLSKENGFNILKRDSVLSSNATGGVALLANFLKSLDFKPQTVVQLFPPMPLINLKQLEQGIEKVHLSKKYNSACFIAKTKHYTWLNDKPVYYQEGEEIPNGVELPIIEHELPTAYIVNVEEFEKTNSRTSKPLYKLDTENELFEIDIDYDHDFSLVNALLTTPTFSRQYDFYSKVRVYYPPIIFWDIDGTLTDGFYNNGPNEEIFKSFHTYDGIALKELNALGIINCFVSASKSNQIITSRAKLLGAEYLTDVEDKVEACKNFAKNLGYNIRECYFVGNDVNDLEVMDVVGRCFCPTDAAVPVKKIAEILPKSSQEGGTVRLLKDKLVQEKSMERNNE
jgi:3-deoxy-D-manno-octulosonate 8-phosphate phosphatase (KDO 8-P phosphatase)